jgi:hypothetical protein
MFPLLHVGSNQIGFGFVGCTLTDMTSASAFNLMEKTSVGPERFWKLVRSSRSKNAGAVERSSKFCIIVLNWHVDALAVWGAHQCDWERIQFMKPIGRPATLSGTSENFGMA